MIEKKFNMYSTKEWLQFLQYKLSPEREKELTDRVPYDPFLKEAYDAISTQENRPVAFQSLSYLINQIEEATGVSESNIMAYKSDRPELNKGIDKKWFLYLAGLVLLGFLCYGIYYLISNNSFASAEVETTATDTAAITNYIDTSNSPLDVIPGAISTDTPITSTQPNMGAIVSESNVKPKPLTPKPQVTTNANFSSTTTTTSAPAVSDVASSSKENDQFKKAQDLYKRGDAEGKDEAKKILINLSSYDNTEKAKAEKILKSLNQGN